MMEVQEAAHGIVVTFGQAVSLGDDNIPAIAAELFRQAQRLGRRMLSLDLGRVDFLSSTALGAFIRLDKAVRVGGGKLVLCNVPQSVYEVFEVARLHTILDIRPRRHPRPVRPLRVLVVDDFADSAETLSLLLGFWGHQTLAVRDGPAALEAAAAFRPHVVMLDFLMPGLTGGEVALRLRRQEDSEGLILVLTTANAREEPCLTPYSGLFNFYLRKPYNLTRLETMLAACVAAATGDGPTPPTARE